MMASMPMGPSFSPHPGGIQQHPGAPPGHHMAPGMAHNPSQPGATPAMAHQMVAHLGVSGPGPQISAGALMGGMPPGTPNAHAAMQHLNPQQMVAYQQQMNGIGFPNNQAMQQQLQQVRLQQLQQAQHQRIMQAQQAQYNNMGGMPIGVPGMPQMNPQQMAQLMQRRAMGAPMPMHHMQQHLAQQHPQGMNPNLIAQQLALQQQQQQLQQQQQQMAQQGNNPGQHPVNPQGPGGMNMQAQLAALHTQQAHAQQSAAAVQAAQAQAQAQQGGPGQPQQPQQQPQAQPPQQPPQQQPGQPQQPNQQQPQVQPGPGVNGPAQNQGPAPGPTPQPNAQQQVSPQTPQTTQAQQAQLAHAQQVQAAANVASLMQQQKRENSANLKGQCLLKLNLFNEHLNGFTGSQGADGLKYWHHFVQRFFSQKGVFRQTFKKREDDGSDSKPYEIDYAALPRFFNVHFESGVSKMQLVMQGTTDKALPHDGHFIEIAKASVFYWYDSGSHVVHNGTLRIQFDSEQNIELFDFVVENHEEYHSRRAIIEAARPSHTWIKEWKSLNPPDSKQSPEMSKKGKQRPFKSPMTPPPDIELPPSCVKIGVGIPEGVWQFLEMADIIGQMNPLFIYSHSHPGISAYAALEQFMTQVSGQGPYVNGQPMPQGVPRTPGYNQFPMGASPAMTNQMLPGSPHMGSPAPGQMQAPPMQLQVSQQGTNSSGPSANTSPQQQNKKRRASQAKLEDDGPTSAPTPATIGTPQMPQMNGVQGKAKHPPTPRMQKRMKNN